MKLLMTLALLFVASCNIISPNAGMKGTPTESKVRVSINVIDYQLLGVISGLHGWNKKLNIDYFSIVFSNPDLTISTDDNSYRDDPNLLGFFVCNQIGLRSSLRGDELKVSIYHELGHSIGLMHDEKNPYSIMYPYLDGMRVTEPGLSDVLKAKKIINSGRNAIEPCITTAS